MEALVNIEGKPLEKLIDVVSKGIGAWCAPWQMRRLAKAEADANFIKTIGEAKTQAILTGDMSRAETLEQVNSRIIYSEVKRQHNINQVVSYAALDYETKHSESSKEVDGDWITRYFSIVQDISTEEMQILWGKILSGETANPGTYSLRTLELLRNLTKNEAELFAKYCQFVLRGGSHLFVPQDAFHGYDKFELKYTDIMTLLDIGLIIPSSTTEITCSKKHAGTIEHSYFEYGKSLAVRIGLPENISNIHLSINMLSGVGKELYELIEVKPDIDYLKYFASIIKKCGNVSVSYATITDREKNTISFQEPMIEL